MPRSRWTSLISAVIALGGGSLASMAAANVAMSPSECGRAEGVKGAIVVAEDDSQSAAPKRRQTRSAYSLSPNVPDNPPADGDTGQRPKTGSGGSNGGDGDRAAGPSTSGPVTGSTRGLKPRSP